MNDLQKSAVLVALAAQMDKKGSRCSETHMQKAVYFLQRLLAVPTNFDFVLYKYGPFSFDLRDQLTGMRADGILYLTPQPPYGPSFVPTKLGMGLVKHFSKSVGKYHKKLNFVATCLAAQNVAELEKLATALYVTLDKKIRSVESRSNAINELKPHISLEEAAAAVKKVDKMVSAARA